ncbi:MAG: hypothetical protein ACFE8O_12465 [Candidatus Hermodarchaeota archaeon]
MATVLVLITLALVIVGIWALPAYLRDLYNPVQEYDYIIFQDDTLVKAKNGKNGAIELSSTNASTVMNQAITQGNNVHLKSGEYTLSSDILLHNKKNARIIGGRAVIRCNGKKIIIKGDNYTSSQHNTLSGLEIINGTVRIENSFKTTVTGMVFRNCTTAIELINTETWSEATKIEDSLFVNSLENIVFRTPVNPATGSYANTEISRCCFELSRDSSVGIWVEPDAEFTGGLIQNVRIWMGKFERRDQTGISADGPMLQTLLQNVVFESFADSPINIYGIKLGEDTEPPILGRGITFEPPHAYNFTAKISNPFGKWIYGSGGSFKREDVSIPVGLNNKYGPDQTIDAYRDNIADFKARIQVEGTFSNGENLTIRFRLEFIDNAISNGVEKSFNQTATLWLDDDDYFELTPQHNIIWAILVDAKTTYNSTNTTVQIDLYGTTA